MYMKALEYHLLGPKLSFAYEQAVAVWLPRT